MFETAELHRKIDKAAFEKRAVQLRTELLAAQNALRSAKFPVVVVIAGVEGAGKGETVNQLHEWMDPRWIGTHASGEPSDEERARPPFWRWWRALPPKGRIGIFHGSWYTDPIVRRARGELSAARFDAALARIAGFERALVDDGALMIKLWFHISKKVQKKRFEALETDKATSWRVTREDWARHERYDRYRKISERALRETSNDGAPWTLVEGEDARWRALFVGEHVLSALQERLARAAQPPITTTSKPRKRAKTILDTVDLKTRANESTYDDELARAQARIARRLRALRALNGSLIVALEGWDAAGKGGAIRRLTASMDARHYQVIPVAAPTDEEKAQHYLWRFWRHMPRQGRITIFDRTWYGRVLVERVEKFCSERDWMRAYTEINEFEEQLHDHGAEVVKMWLHVDEDTQLARFKEREQTPFKQFKIGPEDWRNREKRVEYEHAVDDMVARTSTEFAPWLLIPANDKKRARLLVLDAVGDRLEAAIRRAKKRRK